MNCRALELKTWGPLWGKNTIFWTISFDFSNPYGHREELNLPVICWLAWGRHKSVTVCWSFRGIQALSEILSWDTLVLICTVIIYPGFDVAEEAEVFCPEVFVEYFTVSCLSCFGQYPYRMSLHCSTIVCQMVMKCKKNILFLSYTS